MTADSDFDRNEEKQGSEDQKSAILQFCKFLHLSQNISLLIYSRKWMQKNI